MSFISLIQEGTQNSPFPLCPRAFFYCKHCQLISVKKIYLKLLHKDFKCEIGCRKYLFNLWQVKIQEFSFYKWVANNFLSRNITPTLKQTLKAKKFNKISAHLGKQAFRLFDMLLDTVNMKWYIQSKNLSSFSIQFKGCGQGEGGFITNISLTFIFIKLSA